MIEKLKIKIRKKILKIIKISAASAILLTLSSFNVGDENSIYVSELSKATLIPSGQAVAMKLKTNGVMVVGTEKGLPARNAGLEVGDIITAVNGIKVLNTNHFEDIISKSDGEKLSLSLKRGSKKVNAEIKAEKNSSGQLVCGMWLRDSAAGIGTISFYSSDKTKFYALGHPINDNDTNQTYDIRKGSLSVADIKGAKKGEKNNPGELIGSVGDFEIGSILQNTGSGITGNLESTGVALEEPMKIMKKSEIKTGKAYIMSTVSDEGVGKYEIEIIKILNGDENKDFIIKVTDEGLIEKTGGIVRGMSGSPIIKDGKIVGAVTHVMINDPKKGYGISIDNMLSQAPKNE